MKRWLFLGLTLVLTGVVLVTPAPSILEEPPGLRVPPRTPEPIPTPAGRWIEVSLSEPLVRLHDGEQVMGEYLAATGMGDSPDTTTYPGLFAVYQKNEGPIYLSAYGVYVSHWVGFDEEHDNGFHSLPLDASGRVLDSRLGQRVSHGCVRTARSAEVFRFATFGMKVWVH